MTALPTLISLPGSLTFTRTGEWLHDGTSITHEGLCAYLSNHLRYYESYGFVIQDGHMCVSVQIEDTPFVVRSIDISSHNWNLHLNDQSLEVFHPEGLRYRAKGGFVVPVKSGAYKASFLTFAIQALIPFLDLIEEDTYILHYQGVIYQVLPE